MGRIDEAIKKVKKDIRSKDVLEIACGRGLFSLKVFPYVNSITCIDIDDSKLSREIKESQKIHFVRMDAMNLRFESDSFDAVVFYNAIAHIDYGLEKILGECYRILRKEGQIIIISSFKIDKTIIETKILSTLEKTEATYSMSKTKNYVVLKITI